MKIGFIGLGIMGKPMAKHLVVASHDVICFNRSRPAVDELAAAGAIPAADAAEVAAAAQVVVTVLPDAPDVRDVVFGDKGLIEGLSPGALVIDCSTIAPDAAVDIATRLAERDVQFVDAPVSGGEAGAVAGKLAIMMGGDPAAVERAVAALDAFTGVAAHVGPSGSGQLVKAANQMLVAGNIALVAEALTMLQRTDVDVPAALDVLGGGLAASRVLEMKAPVMLSGDFTPGFRIDLHYKDLGIGLRAADQAGVAVPVTGLVTQLVQGLRAAGDGGADHASLIKAIERLSGKDGHA